MNGVSRRQSDILLQEKKKLLEEYFPKDVLYGTNSPYLQKIFGKPQR